MNANNNNNNDNNNNNNNNSNTAYFWEGRKLVVTNIVENILQ